MFCFKFHKYLGSILVLLVFSICACQAEILYEENTRAADIIGVPVCKWQDPQVTNPRAVVVLVHGLTQHAYSLNELARGIAGRGYVVYGITERGHGAWHKVERKKLRGYNCDFRRSVADLNALNAVLKRQYSELPLYMIGESVGAAVILRSAAGASSDLVNGIVLCSCGTKKMPFKMSWLMSDVLTSWFRPWRQINTARYQIEYACESRSIVEETLKDPLARPTLSGIEIIKARAFIKRNAKFAEMLEPSMSLLVVQGECDRTIDGKSAREVFEAAGASDKSIVIVPCAGHMLIGRPQINPVVTTAISSWLDKQAQPESLASGTTVLSP